MQVKEQDTRVNEPLRYEGVKFFQASFGFAARIQVKDSTGKVLHEGGVPLQYTTEDQKNSFGKLPLPNQGVDAFVITAASGQTDAQIQPGDVAIKVQPTDQDSTIGQKVITQGQTAQIGDLTYTFLREQQYTGLMVSDDPGALWVWVGSTMIVAGMTITMFFRHRRIWVRVQPSGDGSRIRLASSERHDTAYEGWVSRLVDDLSADLGATPTPGHHTTAGRDHDRADLASTVGA